MDSMALMMAPQCHTWVSHLLHLKEDTPSNITQNKTCLFCNSSCCWFICNPLKILSLILAIPLQFKTDLVNVRFAFSFANAALSVCFYLLSGCALQFLKVTLNPDPILQAPAISPNLMSSECYKHTSIFQIMTENIPSFPRESDLADISHVTALFGSVEGWKCKTFPSFILCSFWKHRH